MPVDPQVQSLLELLDQIGFSLSGADVAGVRQMMSSVRAPTVDVAIARVEEHAVPTSDGGVSVRVYVPAAAEGTIAPALLWIHGGGFVIGTLDDADNTARLLADRSSAVVVSVDYRLAPEAPCPAAIDDCIATLDWVIGHADELGIDAARLAVGGDSAGGNLAALLAIHARDHDTPLRQQLLVYPVTDLTASHPSIEENGEGYLLTKEAMAWFMGHYLGGQDPKDPHVSPFFVDDLRGLAPAVVYTAEFDPLRDEGEAYAARLADAGVEVELQRWDGLIHGFFSFTGVLAAADEAMGRAGAGLHVALA